MSILNKLVAVFGVNAKLNALYTAEQVIYESGATSLSFPVGTAEGTVPAKVVGTYTAELTAKPTDATAEEAPVEYQLTEVFVAPPVVAAKEPVAKPKVKQTPAYGFETQARF